MFCELLRKSIRHTRRGWESYISEINNHSGDQVLINRLGIIEGGGVWFVLENNNSVSKCKFDARDMGKKNSKGI